MAVCQCCCGRGRRCRCVCFRRLVHSAVRCRSPAYASPPPHCYTKACGGRADTCSDTSGREQTPWRRQDGARRRGEGAAADGAVRRVSHTCEGVHHLSTLKKGAPVESHTSHGVLYSTLSNKGALVESHTSQGVRPSTLPNKQVHAGSHTCDGAGCQAHQDRDRMREADAPVVAVRSPPGPMCQQMSDASARPQTTPGDQ